MTNPDPDHDADSDPGDGEETLDGRDEHRRLASTLADEPHWAAPEDVRTLGATLSDPDPDVRTSAAEALISVACHDWDRFVVDDGIDVLVDGIAAADPAVGGPIASQASRLPLTPFDPVTPGGIRLLSALADAVEDHPDPDVRRQAAFTFTDGFAIDDRLLEPPAGPRRPVGERITEALTAALDDPEPSVRSRAAGALAWPGRPTGWLDAAGTVEGLVRTLHADDDPEVRRSAAASLGSIGSAPRSDPAVGGAIDRVGGVDALGAALGADDVRLNAFAGLGLLRIHDGPSAVVLEESTVDRGLDAVRAALDADVWSYDPITTTSMDDYTFDHPAVLAPLQDVLLERFLRPGRWAATRRHNASRALEGLGSYVDDETVETLELLADSDEAQGSDVARRTLEAIEFRAQVQCEDSDAPDPAPGYEC